MGMASFPHRDAILEAKQWLEHDSLCPTFSDHRADCTCGLSEFIIKHTGDDHARVGFALGLRDQT